MFLLADWAELYCKQENQNLGVIAKISSKQMLLTVITQILNDLCSNMHLDQTSRFLEFQDKDFKKKAAAVNLIP